MRRTIKAIEALAWASLLRLALRADAGRVRPGMPMSRGPMLRASLGLAQANLVGRHAGVPHLPSCDLATTDLDNSGPRQPRTSCGTRASVGAGSADTSLLSLWNRACQRKRAGLQVRCDVPG